jgi:hypothetical protein
MTTCLAFSIFARIIISSFTIFFIYFYDKGYMDRRQRKSSIP